MPALRKCSLCQLPGHDKRKCPSTVSSPAAGETVFHPSSSFPQTPASGLGEDEEHDTPSGASDSLTKLGYCGCKGRCDDKKCRCRKDKHPCNPQFCGCCTDTLAACNNMGDCSPFYHPTGPFLDELDTLPVDLIRGSLVIASWNIQSFGYNRLVSHLFQNQSGSRQTRPYAAAVALIAGFMRRYDVDLLFIQETIDHHALEDVVATLNSSDSSSSSSAYKLSWVPTFVLVGHGFNKCQPRAPKPDELAAVILKRSPDAWALLSPSLQAFEFCIEGLHPCFEELRERFKRHPAFLSLSFAEETFCLCTLHLASDSTSGSQRLRLNAEILSLTLLVSQLKALTGVDHVILLGDFNRNPDTVCFSDLYESGHVPALLEGATNMGKVPHLYDNFILPRAVRDREGLAAVIGGNEWMILPLPTTTATEAEAEAVVDAEATVRADTAKKKAKDKPKSTSDHRPILLALPPL